VIVSSGAPAGKRVIIFVDDLNMPKLDTYGSQPPIELLRQFMDFGGLYDREKLFWKEFHVCRSVLYERFEHFFTHLKCTERNFIFSLVGNFLAYIKI